ncbi:MAG: hypothetical protein EP332_02340 [Bacteroidetes bacterium]|nr:MAG: hypothetical protein EP332_02340 [Bacteroidota bacterium]
MSELETYELFDAYLRGELSGKELDDFVRRMQEDSTFKEALDMHVMLVRGIEEHRKQELKAFLKEQTSRSFLGNPFGAKYTWFAAAVLAFFALVYVGFEYGLKEEFAQLNESKEEVDTVVQVQAAPTEQIERQKNNEPRGNQIPPVPEATDDKDVIYQEDEVVLNEVKKAYIGSVQSEVEEIEMLDEPENLEMTNDAEENKLPVRQDTKIYDTQMVVRQLAWTTDSVKITLRDNSANSNLAKAKPESNRTFKETSDKKITIEYWGSPINYKGYRFDGRKLVLFGQDEQSEVHVVALLTDVNLGTYRYFFKLQGSYYELFDDNVFRAYKAITDSRILTKLP